ncbi:MAG: GNAT family N-acetyltransferase [Myxococcota bacterium]
MFEGPLLLTPKINLTRFSSGKPSLDDWVRNHALAAHRGGSTRVFVVHDDDRQVIGLYALSAGSVAPEVAPERVRKGQGNYPIPLALITRLGVDENFQGLGIGKALLKDAILRVMEAAHELGIRAIHTHAKDEDAKEFYVRFGFEQSPIHPLWMFLLMKDARASLK